MSRKQLIAVVAVGATVAATVLTGLFFLRDGDVALGPFKRKPPEKPAPTSNFKMVEARAIDPQDRPEAINKATEVAGVLTNSLNEMYTHAFLRPGRWGGSSTSTPETPVLDPQEQLTGFFNVEARPTVPQNIGALAIAELGPQLTRVEPTKQETKIAVWMEPDLSNPFAVATVVFEGTGTTKDKAEGPLTIVHTATYWFIHDGDAFRIYSYNVELKADTVVKSAAFGDAEIGATR